MAWSDQTYCCEMFMGANEVNCNADFMKLLPSCSKTLIHKILNAWLVQKMPSVRYINSLLYCIISYCIVFHNLDARNKMLLFLFMDPNEMRFIIRMLDDSPSKHSYFCSPKETLTKCISFIRNSLKRYFHN